MTTGDAEMVFQTTGGTRLVADSKKYAVALVGHLKMTLVPEEEIVSRGKIVSLKMIPTPPGPP